MTLLQNKYSGSGFRLSWQTTRAAHCGERSSLGKGCLQPHLQYTCKELCYSSTTYLLPVQPTWKLLLLHLHPCLWWLNLWQQLPPPSHPSPATVKAELTSSTLPGVSFTPDHSPRTILISSTCEDWKMQWSSMLRSVEVALCILWHATSDWKEKHAGNEHKPACMCHQKCCCA